MSHPSLSADFVPPAPLVPQRIMEPYVPCWCGSGKKWKWCHKHRDRRPSINIGEQIDQMRSEFVKGYCSHPDASPDTCSGSIVRAHTVQRRGGLAAIAENGHVTSAMSAAQDIFKNDGEFVPREVGIRGASTFMGFCNLHDTVMFQPVERGAVTLTSENCFLLSFRAIAYEYFTKQTQLRTSEILRNMDFGTPFEQQVAVQNYVHAYVAGIRRGLSDMERWKLQYDAIFREQRFNDHRFLAVEFSDVLPVVGCGGFHPEYDFEGSALQKIGRGNSPHEHVTFNLSVLNGNSVVVLGLTERTGGPAEEFLHSFMNVPDEEKPAASIRLAFEHVENIYFKPSWWAGLNEDSRNTLTRRISSGMGLRENDREPGCLRDDGHRYAQDVKVMSILNADLK